MLENGVAFHHFAYMQNSSYIRYSLTGDQQDALAMGTTANEAVHNQINVSQRTVTQQHKDNCVIKFDAFSLAHLLAHGSAAYSPTLVQRSQADIISYLQGSVLTRRASSVNV